MGNVPTKVINYEYTQIPQNDLTEVKQQELTKMPKPIVKKHIGAIKEYSLKKRINEFNKLHQKDPYCINTICESNDFNIISPCVQVDYQGSVCTLRYLVTKHTIPEPNKIYLYHKDILLPLEKPMGKIYEKYKDEDGFLYIEVVKEPKLLKYTI